MNFRLKSNKYKSIIITLPHTTSITGTHHHQNDATTITTTRPQEHRNHHQNTTTTTTTTIITISPHAFIITKYVINSDIIPRALKVNVKTQITLSDLCRLLWEDETKVTARFASENWICNRATGCWKFADSCQYNCWLLSGRLLTVISTIADSYPDVCWQLSVQLLTLFRMFSDPRLLSQTSGSSDTK